MQIRILPVEGKELIIDVENANTTCSELKQLIEAQHRIDRATIGIIFCGLEWQDQLTFKEHMRLAAQNGNARDANIQLGSETVLHLCKKRVIKDNTEFNSFDPVLMMVLRTKLDCLVSDLAQANRPKLEANDNVALYLIHKLNTAYKTLNCSKSSWQESKKIFYESCSEAINEAKLGLLNNLDWQDKLANFLKTIANILFSIIPVYGSNSFFTLKKPQTVQVVEDAEHDITRTIYPTQN
ncbi:hypothetical protein [Legionella worsleiensis]|uniref:Substrate of the Dot/Icm secretion system n=1 Tax=Legionella worsleiensis TaxID=45076 RepID=A0A0W1ALL2_9GAMM|nr:hypothetical protein [Legionella worsleiensis]KTD82088.1 substrate of the Dot/Icm secretion system [Legionella worsleiensis]STY31489.1 Dot/Icm secretion system substrate [Legionella worsleiensis]